MYFLYKKLCETKDNIPKLTKDTRKEINKLCESASTEYVYCKTLLESRYNWKIKKDNYTSEEYEERKTALNIRNSMRYIETAKYRCSNAQTDSTHAVLDKADRLSKIAKRIAYISLIVTIISCILTLHQSCDKATQKQPPVFVERNITN